MCKIVLCEFCQRSTWSGCGLHIDAVLAEIPVDQRCEGWAAGVCPQRESVEKALNEEMTDHRDMIGVITSPSQLLPDYADADLPGFVPGITYLAGKYSMRRVRGDGNCFYRAFLFAYLEQLLTLHENSDAEQSSKAAAERERILSVLVESKIELIGLGYDEIGIECFHDAIVDLVENLFSKTRDVLLSEFQEDGPSDYYTWFMRLLTAGAMIRQEDRFLPFVMDGMFMDMRSYAKAEIEPMGKECEQVHIVALSEYLGVSIRIEYLDGRPFEEGQGLSAILFPESADQIAASNIAVSLLYRPGHYDILYPLSVQ